MASTQDWLNDFAVHIRKSSVDSVVPYGKAFVIDS